MKEVKGLSKKKGRKKLTSTDDSMVIMRGKGWWGEVREVKEGISGDGRRVDLGW